MKPLVYIAGPYTNPDPVENTNRAIKVGLELRERFDVAVLIPHLTLMAHLVEPRGLNYWYRFDLDQVEHCSAVFRIEGASSGADAEVAFADERGIPVFYESRHLADFVAGWRMVDSALV